MKNKTGTRGVWGWVLLLVGVVVAVLGLALGAGGGYLVFLGGSWYFLLMGVAMLVSGVLIAARKPLGAWIYALAFIATVLWAIADAGLNFWPLVSRLMAFAVIGIVIALFYPALARFSGGRGRGRGSYAVAGLMALGVIAALGYMFVPTPVLRAASSPEVLPVADGQAQQNWETWSNTDAGDRFAALDQINKGNVDQLKVAWTFRTGDIPISNGSGAEDQNTALQIGDTLYHCTAYGKVFALNVDTGEERWRFDPQATAPNWQRCRGLGYYEDAAVATAAGSSDSTAASAGTGNADSTAVSAGNGSTTGAALAQSSPAMCRKRLFLPTIDARLIAIDAETGEPCADFGDNGVVDLKVDMGHVTPGWYQQTSSPLVAGNLVVVGGRIADNYSVDEPPGVVRAYDVHSGALVWAWDPGNPQITQRPPAGQTYTRDTPNVWGGMSYDPELGLIYLPTGNSTPDFVGMHRTALDSEYSSSMVAVDAATGRVRWHYQMAHHDLWDFDVPAQPLLYDVPDGHGGTQPALIQVTKQGEIFMLNRETGEPIADVEERPVPQGNTPGETYSPTQPFSVGMPSIGTETLTESDMWGATPFDQLLCRIEFKGMRYDGPFTPPGMDRSLQFPGSLGGMNWGSVSVDPTNHYMFVNDMRLGLANYLIPRENIPAGASGIEMGIVPQAGTPFGAMRERFLSPLGIPCQKPPFGTMSAIDLQTRKLVWQVPVGTVQDTGPLGIKMHLPIPIGMPTLGASMATQSGLVFFAGTQDYYLRAFDSGTGKELWKARLPVGSQSGPMTYVSPSTGKQYVVVSAGGARQSPDRGDYVIAYALPDAAE